MIGFNNELITYSVFSSMTILARLKICALKSYRCVKIMNTNNGLALQHKLFCIIWYFLISLRLPTAQHFITFNIGKITDVLT